MSLDTTNGTSIQSRCSKLATRLGPSIGTTPEVRRGGGGGGDSNIRIITQMCVFGI